MKGVGLIRRPLFLRIRIHQAIKAYPIFDRCAGIFPFSHMPDVVLYVAQCEATVPGRFPA
jgi:hypothetical protein